MRNQGKTYRLVLTALFIALGLVLPLLTAHVPQFGSMLLPMHIPVLICGFVCGWQYGLIAGVVTPLLGSATSGMPPLFPVAVVMALEMGTYGAVSGWLYSHIKKSTASVYISLLVAMLAGRIVWGLVNIPIYGIVGKAYSWQIFMAGAFINAIPGIILQIVLVPLIVLALERAHVIGTARG